MSHAEDPEQYRRRLEAKLAPVRIRSTLAFAGLYQLTHEMIKTSILGDVKSFFGYVDLAEGVWLPSSGETQYRAAVLSRDRNPFKASLLWLADRGAITADQMSRLDKIYDHRHDLTHELGKYLIDPDFEPDVDLFADALRILRDVMRFWVQVDKDLGTFEEFGDVDTDEVVPGRIALLDTCIQAYMGGLTDQPYQRG